jgi:hypothetical protein
MPAHPAYFHRLADAIGVLEKLPSAWIDRRTLQEVLGVSKTVAWRILRQCGASQGPGNTLVCPRQELAAALENLRTGRECVREVRRRQRLEERLTQLVTMARSHHVQVVPDSRALELFSTRFANLPGGVEISPARLTIDFFGTEDFLAKFGAVVFALQNDFEAISRFIEQSAESVNHARGAAEVSSPGD